MEEPSGAAAAAFTKPAVVEGRKELEEALTEGFFPVVDKSIDVFAMPSAPGEPGWVWQVGVAGWVRQSSTDIIANADIVQRFELVNSSIMMHIQPYSPSVTYM